MYIGQGETFYHFTYKHFLNVNKTVVTYTNQNNPVEKTYLKSCIRTFSNVKYLFATLGRNTQYLLSWSMCKLRYLHLTNVLSNIYFCI